MSKPTRLRVCSTTQQDDVRQDRKKTEPKVCARNTSTANACLAQNVDSYSSYVTRHASATCFPLMLTNSTVHRDLSLKLCIAAGLFTRCPNIPFSDKFVFTFFLLLFCVVNENREKKTGLTGIENEPSVFLFSIFVFKVLCSRWSSPRKKDRSTNISEPCL